MKFLKEAKNPLFFDVETEGLDHKKDRILQVAYANRITSNYRSRNIKEYYLKHADARIPGICSFTQDDLLAGQSPKAIMQVLYSAFLQSDLIVAYNASFDVTMLAHNVARELKLPLWWVKLRMGRKLVVDPMLIYRWLNDGKFYGQAKLAKKLELEVDEALLHDAAYDVELLANIYNEVSQEIQYLTPWELKAMMRQQSAEVATIFKEPAYKFPFRS